MEESFQCAGILKLNTNHQQQYPKVGETAPDFTLDSFPLGRVSLHDFRGKTVVLYFYPKDGSVGCTKEACDIRDNFHNFRSLGAEVLGISTDSVKSHEEFARQNNLKFILLSDPTAEVCRRYGTLTSRGAMTFADRVTFLIGKDGKIRYVFPKVDPSHHSQELVVALQKSQSETNYREDRD
jgi:peroxiredoxin Q/BCP